MKQVYHLNPVNKTTAIAVSQTGCTKDSKLTDEQLRENLVIRVKKIDTELKAVPKGFFRSQLGKEKQEIQNKITAIRPKKKSPGIENFFIEAARETLTKPQFSMLMSRANQIKETKSIKK